MTFRLRTCLSIGMIAALFFVSSVNGQTCDFSKYRPLNIDHFLLYAVIEVAKPVYPAAGKALRVQGTVHVRILVDRRGSVLSTCVVDGHPLLRAAAEKAARESKFKKNFGLEGRQKRKYIEDVLTFNFVL